MTTRIRRMIARTMFAGAIVLSADAHGQAQSVTDGRQPLDVARILAARYPTTASMSYIPAVAWGGSLRLAALTGEARWLEKPREDMAPFLVGEQPTITEPHVLTRLAGHLAFSDLARPAEGRDGDERAGGLARSAADLILPHEVDEVIRFGRGWTDDMFMATSLLAREAARTGDVRYAAAIGPLLTTYAGRLQRPDGLFVHAVDGPYAWGRGNGFAALGLVEALTHLPASWSDREEVLEIYRHQMSALAEHQSDDGSWRQVVDEPTSYRELTVTALAVTAMARGVRMGWLDSTAFLPIIERGWQAVLSRVAEDGTLLDVCASTGAGTTLEYYLERPIVNGADDRGGALVLLAALEMEELGPSLSRR